MTLGEETPAMTHPPTPAFKIGDVVFLPVVDSHATRLPCPDCRDARTWTVTTPAGDTFPVDCQRCANGIADVPALYDRTFIPRVKTLTIGQVKIEWPASTWGDGEPVNYMCEETGVGSGQVYRESRLYGTEAVALSAAAAQAAAERAAWLAKPEPAARRAIGRLSLRAALGATAAETLSLRAALGATAAETVWHAAYHFGQLKERLEAQVHDGVHVGKEELDALLDIEIPWHLDPAQNPVVALVRAARSQDAAALAAAVEPFAFIEDTEDQV